MLGAGANVFAVWSWVIANAGPKGILEINPPLLAALIGEPVDVIEKAVAYLCAPDENSRSSEAEGRRLIHESAFTYRVVNHDHYRAARNAEERRMYKREKQREYRSRVSTVDSGGQCVDSVDRRTPKTEDRRQKQKTEAVKRESPPEGATRPLPPECIEIAQYLYEAIRSHSPGFLADAKPATIEKKLATWARDIDRGMRLDGMTGQGARDAIDAAHRSDDEFWRPNMLSGKKLRKHYEKLRIRKRAKATTARPAEGFDFVGAGNKWREALGEKR
jgi:hypothetical protein